MKTENQFRQSLEVLSRITILILFIIMLNSCKDVGVDFNETLPNPIITSEELKIYGIVLEEINTNSLIVLADTTMIINFNGGFDIPYDNFIDDYLKLHKETFDAYSNPFSKKRVFKEFPFDTKHNLVFLTQHPYQINEPGVHGIVRFSNIGFNKSKTQALLLISDFLAPLAGYGYNVILEKENNKWKIVKKLNFFIS
ncbi:MAG: hypothetical protein WCZ90_07045 [Melioribacteraceae bacterium]